MCGKIVLFLLCLLCLFVCLFVKRRALSQEQPWNTINPECIARWRYPRNSKLKMARTCIQNLKKRGILFGVCLEFVFIYLFMYLFIYLQPIFNLGHITTILKAICPNSRSVSQHSQYLCITLKAILHLLFSCLCLRCVRECVVGSRRTSVLYRLIFLSSCHQSLSLSAGYSCFLRHLLYQRLYKTGKVCNNFKHGQEELLMLMLMFLLLLLIRLCLSRCISVQAPRVLPLIGSKLFFTWRRPY